MMKISSEICTLFCKARFFWLLGKANQLLEPFTSLKYIQETLSKVSLYLECKRNSNRCNTPSTSGSQYYKYESHGDLVKVQILITESGT